MWLTANHSRSISSLVRMDEMSNPFMLVLTSDRLAAPFYNFDVRMARGVSILRSAGVDVPIPVRHSTGHAFHVLEPGLPEGLREIHRASAAFAVDDDPVSLVAFELTNTLAEFL